MMGVLSIDFIWLRSLIHEYHRAAECEKTLHLNDEIKRLIELRVRSGQYQSAEDVIGAALRSLEQDEAKGQFAEAEWDRLLAEGETGGADLDGEAVFTEVRELRRDEKSA